MEDIKKLKASRSTSAGYDERMQKLDADDKLWQGIKDKMNECDARLDQIQKLQVIALGPRIRLSQSCAHSLQHFQGSTS